MNPESPISMENTDDETTGSKASISGDLFVVVLPDSQGGDCYLAKGSGGDPSRTYLLPYARTYKTEWAAKIAIAAAKKTHPCQERTYRVKPHPHPTNDKAI